jgi:hypothetical protein
MMTTANPNRMRRDLPFVALAALLLISVVVLPFDINVDAALFLSAGEFIVDGGLPYVDIVDTNPPLIMYLSAIPVAISRVVGISAVPIFLLLVAILSIWSAWAIHRVMSSHGYVIAGAGRIALLALGVTVGFRLFGVVMYDFAYGQREHLFFLAYLPFLILRWIRWRGIPISRNLALGLGIVAGVGTCIKPHFLLMAIAPEALWFAIDGSGSLRDRLHRFLTPEFIAFTMTGFAYTAHFFLMPDALRNAYFGRWVPLLLEGGYVSNQRSVLEIIRPEVTFALIVSAWVLISSRFRVGMIAPTVAELARPLALVAIAGIVSYAVQAKGFSYHLVPTLGSLVLVGGVSTAQSRRDTLRVLTLLSGAATLVVVVHVVVLGVHWQQLCVAQSWILVISGVLCTAALAIANRLSGAWADRERNHMWVLRFTVAMWSFLVLGTTLLGYTRYVSADIPYYGDSDAAHYLEQYTKPGDHVLFMTASVGKIYPVLTKMQRRLGSRFTVQWPVAMFAGYNHSPEAEADYFEDLNRDIERYKPRLVMVSANPEQDMPPDFRMEPYLRAQGFFRDMLTEYAPVPVPVNCEIHAWVRSDTESM